MQIHLQFVFVERQQKNKLPHCKDTRPKIRNKYSQKGTARHSPISYTHVSVSDLYTPKIDLPILLQEIGGDHGNILVAHRHMNVEIRNEAAQFLFWEVKSKFLSVHVYDETRQKNTAI